MASAIGEPEAPPDAGGNGKDGGEIDGIKAAEGNVDIEDIVGAEGPVGCGVHGIGPVAVDTGIPVGAGPVGPTPDIILEYSTGSIPEGTGLPEATAAEIISAGVGSKVPVITL